MAQAPKGSREASPRCLCKEWQGRQYRIEPQDWWGGLMGPVPQDGSFTTKTYLRNSLHHACDIPSPVLLARQHRGLDRCSLGCFIYLEGWGFWPTSGHWCILHHSPTNGCVFTTNGMTVVVQYRMWGERWGSRNFLSRVIGISILTLCAWIHAKKGSGGCN